MAAAAEVAAGAVAVALGAAAEMAEVAVEKGLQHMNTRSWVECV